MGEIVEIQDRFYIHVESALTDRRTLVLKHDDCFGVFGGAGDVESLVQNAQGLYRRDTRFLSRFELRLEGARPALLGAEITRDNARILADFTNPDVTDADGRITLPRGTLHIARARHLWDGAMHERIAVTNFGFHAVEASLTVAFAADFADVFEVRGFRRQRRGEDLDPEIGPDSVRLGYRGLDGVERACVLRFDPRPEEITRRQARFPLRLEPRQRLILRLSAACEIGEPLPHIRFPTAASALRARIAADGARACRIESSNEHMGDWARRSLADLRSLLTSTELGPYPCAGIPWYSTPFGRDGIITAMQLLWVDPEIARGVLACLAEWQADAPDPARDAEPGKILHERRDNEMAATGEIPFARYYGSVDATPLFIILAGAYYGVTGDRGFAAALWPHIERALAWMDADGDPDGDGFLEYRARTPEGLSNQGWKDSQDSISHADGALAEGPIALCEVQGYAYRARLVAAALARILGRAGQAAELDAQAERLRERFESAFWLPELGTYALALDGRKRPCAVRSSNAGHCLFTGIASPERARRVARSLMSERMFTGWGVRTLACDEARYDPMSYHNGSIWPHDNAMIAAGFARYGLRKQAVRVLRGLFAAAIFQEHRRLPELFCGFPRRPGRGPVPYPVACSPQAWAAGAVFMLLRACLGLSVDGVQRAVRIRRPALPPEIRELTIRDLRIAEASVDLRFRRQRGDVAVLVLDRRGAVDVVVSK